MRKINPAYRPAASRWKLFQAQTPPTFTPGTTNDCTTTPPTLDPLGQSLLNLTPSAPVLAVCNFAMDHRADLGCFASHADSWRSAWAKQVQ